MTIVCLLMSTDENESSIYGAALTQTALKQVAEKIYNEPLDLFCNEFINQHGQPVFCVVGVELMKEEAAK